MSGYDPADEGISAGGNGEECTDLTGPVSSPDRMARTIVSHIATHHLRHLMLIQASGLALRKKIREVLGRSLHIREVDAGSCNGCEIEISALNNPVYDIERFGVHFVASPRHADMLLVTGPVTRNMEIALRQTYEATPEPKMVVAVGACGISGGIFGTSYASLGGVANVIPVDVYIPGCPPRPEALLHGIFVALDRYSRRGQATSAPAR